MASDAAINFNFPSLLCQVLNLEDNPNDECNDDETWLEFSERHFGNSPRLLLHFEPVLLAIKVHKTSFENGL